MIIYEDNQSTICLSKNPQFHGRSKHIATRYHYIHDQVKDGVVDIRYCNTEEMLADMFRKGLSGEKFQLLGKELEFKKLMHQVFSGECGRNTCLSL